MGWGGRHRLWAEQTSQGYPVTHIFSWSLLAWAAPESNEPGSSLSCCSVTVRGMESSACLTRGTLETMGHQHHCPALCMHRDPRLGGCTPEPLTSSFQKQPRHYFLGLRLSLPTLSPPRSSTLGPSAQELSVNVTCLPPLAYCTPPQFLPQCLAIRNLIKMLVLRAVVLSGH